MRHVLVAGGCGFIGSNFVRLLLSEEPDVTVTNLDLLTYAGNPRNLEDVEGDERYRFVHGDIRDPDTVDELVGEADWVVNFAAESHVDRSTKEGAGEFIQTNVYGTWVLLEGLRRAGVPPHVRNRRRRVAQHEQLRTVPVPGEAPAPVHHQRDGRRAASALRRGDADPGLALCRG
jgi:dTDP-glucose 4,6-dehydratase